MGFSIREINFLMTINNNNFKITEVAKLNGMCSRNVRYKVENLNFYLNKYINKQIEIKNGNLSLKMSNEEIQILYTLTKEQVLKFTKEERQEIIINMYLFEENTTLSKLSELLDVTRTTLNKDIRDINVNLENRDIKLHYSGKRISLIGNEKKLRHFKSEKLMKYSTLENNQLDVLYTNIPSTKIINDVVNAYLNSQPKQDLEERVKHIEKLLDAKFEKGFYRIITLYLMVTLERVNKNFIIKKKNNEKFLINLKQYEILKQALFEIISEDYKYEYLHLTEYFISGYNSKKCIQSEYAIAEFTKNMLKQLHNESEIKLEEDKSLEEEIVEYLNPAMYRIKNNFTIKEKLDIRSIDNKIYVNVKKICRDNNYLLPEVLREEEIFHISSIVEKFIKQDVPILIGLDNLINIIKNNSNQTDLVSIKKELLQWKINAN